MSTQRIGKKSWRATVVAGVLGGAVIAPAWSASVASVACAAEPSAADRAVAESLFRQARENMGARNFSEACPKFAESYRLDPALGTLLNLAVCHEQQGKIASAWIEFTDAASEAKRTGQADREALAHRKATSLEPKLTYVTLQVPERVAQLPLVEVHLDGMLIGRAVWGIPFPVDEGEHRVDVSARGKKPHTQAVQIARGSHQATAVVEMPEDEPVESTTSAQVDVPFQSTPSAAVATKVPTEVTPRGRAQRISGVVVGVLGVASLGVAGGFTLKAIDDKSQRDQHCDSAKRCDAIGLQADKDGRAAANVATITSVAGAVLVGAGLTLFFTAPKTPVNAAAGSPMRSLAFLPSLGTDGGGIVAAGRW